MDENDRQIGQHLTVSEVSAALQHLSCEDHLRLVKIGAKYSAGTLMTAEELLNEAILRSLDGTRKCPQSVEFIKFLAGVIKSLAWAERQREKADPLTGAVDINDPDGHGPRIAADDAPADDRLEAQREYKRIQQSLLDLFEDDEEVQYLMLCRFEEMPADEIKQQLDMDDRKFATVQRRMRRRIDKAFPEGWQQ